MDYYTNSYNNEFYKTFNLVIDHRTIYQACALKTMTWN